MKNNTTFALIAGIALLLGIPTGWPYVYYQLLRWLVAIVGGVYVYQSYNEKENGWMWVMIAITVLFNPIAPVYLAKETWVLVDFVAAVVMFVYCAKMK